MKNENIKTKKQNAFVCFSDPQLEPEWKNEIFESFYNNGHARMALELFSIIQPTLLSSGQDNTIKEVPEKFLSYFNSLLLAGLFVDAFNLQRQYQSLSKILLSHLLNFCFQGNI